MPWILASATEQRVLNDQESVELGRRDVGPEWVTVSRRQCVIGRMPGGGWILTSCAAKPTFVQHAGDNWMAVAQNEQAPIFVGTKISLDRSKQSSCMFTFSGGGPPATAPASAPVPAESSEEASPILPVAYAAAVPAPLALPSAAAAAAGSYA